MADNSKQPFAEAQELEKRGELAAAAEAYRRDLAHYPGIAEAHHNYARLLNRLGKEDEAVSQSRIALDLSPDQPVIIAGLAQHLDAAGDLSGAIELYRRCLAIDGAHRGALTNLGRLLEATGRPADAVTLLEPAIDRLPDETGLLVNLANAYLALGQPRDAIEMGARALSQNPELAVAHNTIGIAHYVQRQWPEAAASFTSAIQSAPDFAQAHENLAMTLLHQGNFQNGWREYEWRWRNPSNHLTKRATETVAWDGGDLEGRTLLLHGEQGFGDTIQFARFAGRISKSGGKIILACQTELTALMQSVTGIDAVVSLDDEMPAHDCQAPLLGLPQLLDISPESFAADQPYIYVEARDRIAPEGALGIGVVWAGRDRDLSDPYRNRSCPPEFLAGLMELPGVRVYSLQTGGGATDCPPAFEDLSDQITSFSDTARLIQSLDVIVTVDTAVAHLAGALGKECYVALCYAADWRWRDGNGQSPWYPSVQMIRQKSPGGWDEIFAEISDIIARKAL